MSPGWRRLGRLAGTAAAALIAAAVFCGLPARAQEDSVTWPEGISSEQVADVARELNCPLCQGYTLQDCPLPVCGQMRALIAQRLDAGESKASIKAEFVDEYGPQVLGVPPRSGAGLVAWALPGLVLVVAAGVVATLVARSTGHRRRGRPREPAVEGEYEDELERLLAEREA